MGYNTPGGYQPTNKLDTSKPPKGGSAVPSRLPSEKGKGDNEEDKFLGTLAFVNHVGLEEAARFIINLQNAVDGLQKNNESFVKAFRNGLEFKIQEYKQ